MVEERQSARSVRDVLTMSRWSKALFTTYSFNVSFFEGFLLPKLEDVGCSEVHILVDERFYLQSLSERQAFLLGKSYRVHPISCAGKGIFHPKVSYFWGDEYDLIAVSSGNLTYAGHGANLECIDYASSARDRNVFVDFAGFIDDLLQRPQIDSREAQEVLSKFRSRASMRGRAAKTGDDQPSLIHSIRESVGSQVVRSLKDKSQFRRMVCVSPFHHPEGEAVIELAKSLGIRRIDICLDPDGSRAPFKAEVVTRRGLQARFVVPAEKEGRPLHAKWYEFRGQDNFLLTGSVNATQTSMWSVENVEVALLRPVSAKALGDWIEKEPKRIEAPTFSQADRIYQGVVTAVLDEMGNLAGRVSGLKEPGGQWKAELLSMFGRIDLADAIDIRNEGAFLCNAPDALEVEGAIQIRLKRGADVAAGWVEVKVYLDEANETRGARLALGRLSRGEGMQGDVETIVQWLTSFIEQDVTGRKRSAGDTEDEFSDSRIVTYEDFIRESSNPRRTTSSLATLVRHALVTLARGRANASHAVAQTFDSDSGIDDAGPKPVSEEEFDVVSALIRVVNKALEANPANPIGIELAIFKAEHSIRSAIGQDIAQALPSRGMEWVRWVTSIAFPVERRAHLEPVVVAMGACVAGMVPAAHSAAWVAELRGLLKSHLSIWELDNLKVLAKQGLSHRIFDAIAADKKPSLVAALDLVWSARTVSDDLEAFLEGIRAGARPQPTLALEQTIGLSVIKALLDHARDSHKKFYEIGELESANSCPGCGLKIESSDRGELKHRHGIKCRGCSRAILWLGA